ncbi:1-acyl-sn-glycerol-3-phosphate acyltransferase [Nakamurella flavida]|uniref:1-acyl-sn-glycerol-3-phosphate acyltransferase n=1 Tax=Nakamurella flavida TaxID=363630 RepID=A0A938YS74_9ACTN|nr:lysophospholipid acyltransferase family protein [Nakamurella flavida]MBM9478253.1 1-acyl-sn-glycerol-3-phosphate acyltransferase [Nakamurella flavida]MDP9777576.1 1-acyl-sn-glycerol-3-phosphate acyltransferase [Nakamurella flavida]
MRFLNLEGRGDPVPQHSSPRGMDRGRRIGIALGAALYRLHVRGRDRVPATGPLVMVANHTNFMDGPVLFGAFPRRLSFLVKAEAVTGPLGWLLKHVGQYALVRDKPDRIPLLASLAQLQAGGAIGVFPEGTRGQGDVATVFAGAGWLAARSGATIVPVAVRGVSRPSGVRRRFRPRVEVLVGQPFAVEQGASRTAVAAATDGIREHLAALVRTLDEDLAAGSVDRRH